MFFAFSADNAAVLPQVAQKCLSLHVEGSVNYDQFPLRIRGHGPQRFFAAMFEDERNSLA